MTTSPFDDPHLDAAWRAYAAHDRHLAPRPELEQIVLARCLREGARGAERASVARVAEGANSAKGRRITVYALAAAASIALMALASHAWDAPELTPAPLAARAMGASAYPPPVAAQPGRLRVRPPRRDTAAELADAYVQHVELPAALMLFDAGPLQLREPLQMVRLRLPREALQALGLALLEPDAGGVVDVDVLVGEDGLPRDIRQVRIGQEQQR